MRKLLTVEYCKNEIKSHKWKAMVAISLFISFFYVCIYVFQNPYPPALSSRTSDNSLFKFLSLKWSTMKNVSRKNKDISAVIFRTHSSKKKTEFTVSVSRLSLNIIIGTPMQHNLKIYWFCKTENIFRNCQPCCSRGVCFFRLFLLKWRKNYFTSSISLKNKKFTSDQSSRK